MERTHAPHVVELHHSRTDDRHGGRAANVRELPLEPIREGNIVSVEPRDVHAARLVEPAVEGRGEADLRVVPEHSQALVRDAFHDLRRTVSRGVVDDEKLELRHGLSEEARYRRFDVRLAVVHGEKSGDKRRIHGDVP